MNLVIWLVLLLCILMGVVGCVLDMLNDEGYLILKFGEM